MTDIVNPSQNILDKMFELIKRKEAHSKEWRAIAKLEAIYDTELKSIEKQLHRTSLWDIILISNMENDHLLNTVKWQLRYHKWNYKAIPKQYMDEIKARPGLLEQLIDYEPVIEVSDVDMFEDIPF